VRPISNVSEHLYDVLSIRLGLYTVDNPTPSQLAADWDDYLFANILNNPHYVLQNFSRTKLIIPMQGHFSWGGGIKN